MNKEEKLLEEYERQLEKYLKGMRVGTLPKNAPVFVQMGQAILLAIQARREMKLKCN